MFERDFLDILARLIDPPLHTFDDEDLSVEQRFESQFRQLSWPVEYAAVRYLHQEMPTLFEMAPEDKFPDAHYGDAAADLADKNPYYVGPSCLLEYRLSSEIAKFAEPISGSAQQIR